MNKYGKMTGIGMYWLFLSAALAGSGFFQGMTGFGFGLVSMSLMPMFMSIKQAAVISTGFTLLATAITFARHYRDYNWRLGASYLASVCVGLPLGVILLQRSSEHTLIRLLGVAMLVMAAREFLMRGPMRAFPPSWTIPWGIFSGAMSGALNLGGVPTGAYAYTQPWSSGQIMAFLQVMLTLTCTLRIVFYQKAGLAANLPWTYALLLVIPLYVALWLGHEMRNRFNLHSIRKGVFILVGMSGIYYTFLHRMK